MKIMLLQDIKSLGRKFEVKDVADGYAMNFLIPRKLAEQATPERMNQLDKLRKEEEARKEKAVAELKVKAGEMKDLALTFKVAVGEKGQMFGSVSEQDIKKALKGKGVKAERINIEEPIRSLGDHEFEVELGEGIKTRVKAKVEEGS